MIVKRETQKSGVGFLGMLTIAFIVLKLVGTIRWSWWWVLSPLWIPIVIIILAIVIGALIKTYLDE